MSQGGDGSRAEGGGSLDLGDAAFLQSLLAALPAFVLRAGADLKIRYINRLAKGFSIEDTLGGSIFDYIAPEYQEVARLSIERALELNTVQQYLAQAHTDDRAYAYYETIVAPVPEADGGRGVILVAFDVSRTRALEERLRQTDRLESLGTLTAGVAHNFNNLLAVIRPTLDLLRAHVDAGGRPLLDEASQATERATALVRQLMVFAGARSSPDAAPADLGEIVGSAVSLTRRLVGPEIQIVFEPSSGRFPLRNHGNELEQVIVNLIVNARDALRSARAVDGEIRVSVERVEEDASLTLDLQGPRAHVVVQDNGPGIDPEHQPRLFDPFFTTKPAGEGTGLGLAISWSVVRGLGGTIECQSKPGEGARFIVSLPIETPETPS